MEWVLIVVLVVAVPIILFPVAYLWYLNVGGIYAAIKQAREKKAASERGERRLRASAITSRSCSCSRILRVPSRITAWSSAMRILILSKFLLRTSPAMRLASANFPLPIVVVQR